MRRQQVLSLRVRVNIEVMAMKEYSTFPKAPGQETQHQMQFNVTPPRALLVVVVVVGLTSLQECRQRILQPQPTERG